MKTPDFIPHTLATKQPRLNLVDYKVCSVMQKIYEGRLKDVDDLHLCMVTAWDELDHCVIDTVRKGKER